MWALDDASLERIVAFDAGSNSSLFVFMGVLHESQITSLAQRLSSSLLEKDSDCDQRRLVKTLEVTLAAVRCGIGVKVTGIRMHSFQEIRIWEALMWSKMAVCRVDVVFFVPDWSPFAAKKYFFGWNGDVGTA